MSKVCPDDSVKRLDEAAALMHRYTFALVGDRDELIRRAYQLVGALSLDIALMNLRLNESANPNLPEDVCATGK